MPLPFVALDNKSNSWGAPPAVKDLDGVFSSHSMILDGTGTGDCEMQFEVSHDGTLWFRPGVSASISGDDSEIAAITDFPARYVRANPSVFGPNETVTVTIASEAGSERPVPFVSLAAATNVGPGASCDLGGVYGNHLLIVGAMGYPSSYSAALEGSHDGVNWVVLGEVAGPIYNFVGEGVCVTDMPVRYLRANLTDLSGGTSPTVTATIASA